MYSEYLKTGGRIAILPPLLAQKIAAGEVIERPQSVVRELLDNAIDSGADQIDIFLEEGGNSQIVVQDNGCGMDKDNLALSWLPHATSKIAVEADLYAITSMGFRGEALSSIAAVSHLKISSCTEASGGTLSINGGQQITLDPYQGKIGTRVEVGNLFYNLPARKQFLKRSATEFSMVKTMLMEKALAHPSISFRLSNELGLQCFFASCAGNSAFLDRYNQLYPEIVKPKELFHELKSSQTDFEIKLLLGQPMVYQNDRRMMQIFVNRRRINEYALLQAIEFGFTGYLPGGRYPISALFLDINPQRVDVNIHPAKREVKIRDLQAIHSSVVRTIQNFLRTSVHQRRISEFRDSQIEIPLSPPAYNPSVNFPPTSFSTNTQSTQHYQQTMESKYIAPTVADSAPQDYSSHQFRYFGQVFGVFLLVEIDNSLLMLDMHAAHERILYDQFRDDGRKQELLIPMEFSPADPESENDLRDLQKSLSAMGITVSRQSETEWQLLSLPACFVAKPALVCEILEKATLHKENIERSLFATLACHSAIKDGDLIGNDQALSLIDKSLSLPEQRCPHGRPIFFSLSKDELFELVGRKV